MLDLANLGYVGMCLSAFLAATILPFSSEIVLVTLLSTGANETYLLITTNIKCGQCIGGARQLCFRLAIWRDIRLVMAWY